MRGHDGEREESRTSATSTNSVRQTRQSEANMTTEQASDTSGEQQHGSVASTNTSINVGSHAGISND